MAYIILLGIIKLQAFFKLVVKFVGRGLNIYHSETFSESLIQGSKNIANKIIHPFSGKEINTQTQEEFWALKDITMK